MVGRAIMVVQTLREVPPEYEKKLKDWYHTKTLNKSANLLLGGMASVLAVIIGANTQGKFLSEDFTLVLSGVAALCSFLLTALRPQARELRYRSAASEFEAACNDYRADHSLDLKFLARALHRGLKTLERT
jgi:hypothetical protein